MLNRWVAATLCVFLLTSGHAQAAVIFGNTGLTNGSRWDASPRSIGGIERSLDGGLRYSLQGGSYQAYRDIFNWSVVPSVPDFTQAIQDAFTAWTVTDPVSGLGTSLTFVEDLGTPVAAPAPNVTVNVNGAEIDLLGETNGVLWNTGDSSLRAETFFDAIGLTTVDLTSGTTNYPGYAISGADIKMNSNPGALWNLTSFQTVLTHEIGHAIGLGDVDGNFGRFIDDNYNGASSSSALATLTNSWAGLVNPLNPAASPLALYSVANGNPGVDTPGVNIFMESAIPGVFYGNPTPLQNDDFGGRQFLYPELGGVPPEPKTGPIVVYGFPASWDGTGSSITDLSPEFNDGSTQGSPALSTNVPAGADPGASSLQTNNGGLLTNGTNLLNNFTVAAAGGFIMEADIFWDGTTNAFDIMKVIDYAGTEFLQVENVDDQAGTADLRFGFNDTEAFGPVLSIDENTWHHVTAVFDTQGNLVDGNGDLAGLATLIIDGIEVSQAVFKSNFGDGLNRAIGFGTFDVSNIVDFHGLIFDPSVSLFPADIEGDLDGDGFVGIDDLNLVLANWNQNVPPADEAADPSGDGFVGIDDLNAVLGNWNAGTPPTVQANIPEPAGFALVGLASVFSLSRRARR